MFQFGDAWRYWKMKAKDFVLWAGTFIAVVVFDIPIGNTMPYHTMPYNTIPFPIKSSFLMHFSGMAIAIILSIVIILYSGAKPYNTTLVPVCMNVWMFESIGLDIMIKIAQKSECAKYSRLQQYDVTVSF